MICFRRLEILKVNFRSQCLPFSDSGGFDDARLVPHVLFSVPFITAAVKSITKRLRLQGLGRLRERESGPFQGQPDWQRKEPHTRARPTGSLRTEGCSSERLQGDGPGRLRFLSGCPLKSVLEASGPDSGI